MWWFYGWSGLWNMIYSGCSCATFQDKRSWATNYPPELNSISLPFSSKKILETSVFPVRKAFPSPVIRQTWPKNCRLNFPHPPWAKKKGQPGRSRQWQNVKETLKACCSRSSTWFIKTKPLWQGWKIISRQMCNSKSDLLAGKNILTTNHPNDKNSQDSN